MAKDDMRKMMTEASDPEIYREVVVFGMGRAIIVLFMVLTVFFLAMFISEITSESIGENQAPYWFYLAMCLFFAVMTFVIMNFSKLTIKASSKSITVAYGLFNHVIPWDDVADCYPDESSALGNYGGYGIRVGRVNGRTRLVYNVLGGERMVLVLKKGKFNEFVFSTNNPEAVMGVIKQHIIDSK